MRQLYISKCIQKIIYQKKWKLRLLKKKIKLYRKNNYIGMID